MPIVLSNRPFPHREQECRKKGIRFTRCTSGVREAVAQGYPHPLVVAQTYDSVQAQNCVKSITKNIKVNQQQQYKVCQTFKTSHTAVSGSLVKLSATVDDLRLSTEECVHADNEWPSTSTVVGSRAGNVESNPAVVRNVHSRGQSVDDSSTSGINDS